MWLDRTLHLFCENQAVAGCLCQPDIKGVELLRGAIQAAGAPALQGKEAGRQVRCCASALKARARLLQNHVEASLGCVLHLHRGAMQPHLNET